MKSRRSFLRLGGLAAAAAPAIPAAVEAAVAVPLVVPAAAPASGAGAIMVVTTAAQAEQIREIADTMMALGLWKGPES